MTARTIMIQGTGSSVGKSILVTALCRIFRQDGYRVAPFKSQNMSNNSYVCLDGCEISRAQAVQAEACGLEPQVEMNPILLKPASDKRCQVVIMGKPVGHMSASEYQQEKLSFIGIVQNALEKLLSEFDVVVIEGAGSPAEINLKSTEIINMRIAQMAKAPVLLVGDIDRGGIFAQFVGTMELLDNEEREFVRGFIINKFRGDLKILEPGLELLQKRSGRNVLGIIPFIPALEIAEEDTLPLSVIQTAQTADNKLKIHVIKLPHISNFTDFDLLAKEPQTIIRFLTHPERHETPDLVILPGTKGTACDLIWLREQGFTGYIKDSLERGSYLLGICGGFQMLGKKILDPDHVEFDYESIEGMGLLDCVTVFSQEKKTARITAIHIESGTEVHGYEIHMGCTQGFPDESPLFRITERHGIPVDAYDGIQQEQILGTYIHGLFDSDEFCRAFLNKIRLKRDLLIVNQHTVAKLDKYDYLADIVRRHLDMQALTEIFNGAR